MDVYEFAMKMETDGEQFYRSLIDRTDDKLLKAVLNILAREEVNHYKILVAMKNKDPNMPETNIIDDTENIFEQITASGKAFKVNADDIDLYKEAILIEEQSRDFYLGKTDQMFLPEHQEVFRQFAKEEERHRKWLVKIVESGTKFDAMT